MTIEFIRKYLNIIKKLPIKIVEILEIGEGVAMVSRIGGGMNVHTTSIPASGGEEIWDANIVQVQAIQAEGQAAEERQLPAEQAQKLTESMNRFLETASTQLRFKFHDKLNEYYVTIVNSQTDEVVREIPSKKLMDFHAAMRDLVGLLVDRKI